MATVRLKFKDGNESDAETMLDSNGKLVNLRIDGNYDTNDVIEMELPFVIKLVDPQVSSLFKNLQKFRALGLEEVSEKGYTQLMYLHSFDAPEAKVIRERAFYKSVRLTEVRCPKVKIILEYAFSFTHIESFEGGAVEMIDEFSFAYCKHLTSVTLLKMNTMDGFAFSGCAQLKNVEIPMVENIPAGSFKNCVNLKMIRLDRATHIRSEAFSGCINLVSISLGMIETIEWYAFRECFNLKSLTNLPPQFKPTEQDIINAFDVVGDMFRPATFVLVYKIPGTTLVKTHEIVLRPDAKPKLSRGVKVFLSDEDIRSKLKVNTKGFRPWYMVSDDFVENPPKRPAEDDGGQALQRQRRE